VRADHFLSLAAEQVARILSQFLSELLFHGPRQAKVSSLGIKGINFDKSLTQLLACHPEVPNLI
jgi:hypothetical protein